MKAVKLTVMYVAMTLLAGAMLIPFFWMVSTSLKGAGDVFKFPPEWVPNPIEWANYLKVWEVVPFGKFAINSLLLALCVTAGQVFTSAFAAYSFARLNWPGRDKIFFGYLATLMIPSAVTMIPLFLLLRWLGWIDTYKAIIVPAMFTAYGTFMLRQFFMGLPGDLEDSARIDGCSRWGIFWNVTMPLSKPALATLGIFTFLGNWRSFQWPLIVLQTSEKQTLPVGLAYFMGEHSTDWNLLMAGSLMSIVPLVIVFLIGQKFFVRGIRLGGIKG
ncbi:MAG: carbohydrate ABC transporter permease [Planctomycetota bacterium]|nr:carbohydrate ABC transporter permease [Planctomycetota bacterium]